MNLRDQLIRDEKLERRMYRDARGNATIGVGHNLDAKPLTERACLAILDDDIADVMADLATLSWTANLDEARLGVLANMTFNLGFGGLLTFEKFLAAVRACDWNAAAREMLSSKWAGQVGHRATRLATQIVTGTWQ